MQVPRLVTKQFTFLRIYAVQLSARISINAAEAQNSHATNFNWGRAWDAGRQLHFSGVEAIRRIVWSRHVFRGRLTLT